MLSSAVSLILQEMKAMLYAAVEEAPSDESVEPEVISRHFASFDEVFFTFCDRELKKINTFYSGEGYLWHRSRNHRSYNFPMNTVIWTVYLLQKNWQRLRASMQLYKVN